MSNPIIHFSHIYPKLLDQHDECISTARLLAVEKIELADQHPSFLAYDTDYGENHHFPLPSAGTFLLLIFLKPHEEGPALNLVSTLRPWTWSKEQYYRALRGNIFEVEVFKN